MIVIPVCMVLLSVLTVLLPVFKAAIYMPLYRTMIQLTALPDGDNRPSAGEPSIEPNT